jgi:hypothetical protein
MRRMTGRRRGQVQPTLAARRRSDHGSGWRFVFFAAIWVSVGHASTIWVKNGSILTYVAFVVQSRLPMLLNMASSR